MSLAAVASAFALSAPFHAGGTIPRVYTCDGRDVSPPLRWSTPPPGTRSFAVSVVDLDAGSFRHWLAWGIPRVARSLPAGARVGHSARNGFGHPGYGGPCPPPGRAHRYLFSVLALNWSGPPAEGRVIAVARLAGRYGR